MGVVDLRLALRLGVLHTFVFVVELRRFLSELPSRRVQRTGFQDAVARVHDGFEGALHRRAGDPEQVAERIDDLVPKGLGRRRLERFAADINPFQERLQVRVRKSAHEHFVRRTVRLRSPYFVLYKRRELSLHDIGKRLPQVAELPHELVDVLGLGEARELLVVLVVDAQATDTPRQPRVHGFVQDGLRRVARRPIACLVDRHFARSGVRLPQHVQFGVSVVVHLDAHVAKAAQREQASDFFHARVSQLRLKRAYDLPEVTVGPECGLDPR